MTLLGRWDGSMNLEGIDHRMLGRDLLKRVSRSFYLSMRFLPGAMREPVSLGYLLARASDTIADTEVAPIMVRRDCLARFRESLPETRPDFPEFYAEVIREFSPRQSHEGERELLQRLPDLFGWLTGMDSQNRAAVIDVLREITIGQAWDLERFGEAEEATPVACCETAEELETYAYRVAGCVGAFWTRVGFLNLGDRFAEPALAEVMTGDGIAMGKGLQLVNILRDTGEDLRQGRCYLPRAELKAAGWDDESSLPSNAILLAVAETWRHRCREWLSQGWQYVAALRRGRVRFATALPLILAEATLDGIEAAGERALTEKIKVSRSEVRKAMFRSLWC
ncbi:MAG: squalene/phytoene synthase family protein [Verrucomicrobiae bacterium]|nr:squalene/phytoene synthase family protein [Verrucomicrobiae bacterium]